MSSMNACVYLSRSEAPVPVNLLGYKSDIQYKPAPLKQEVVLSVQAFFFCSCRETFCFVCCEFMLHRTEWMLKVCPGIAGEMRTAGVFLMIFIGVAQGKT